MGKNALSSETFSILVRYWHDGQTDATLLRVVRTDTGEEIRLDDGSLLLRVITQPDSPKARYLVRHVKTGREVYLQSGLYLQNFVLDCLLVKDTPPDSPDPDKPSS